MHPNDKPEVKKIRALIIDKPENFDRLKSEDYSYTCASKIKDAIKELEGKKFDKIYLAYELPYQWLTDDCGHRKLSGEEICRYILHILPRNKWPAQITVNATGSDIKRLTDWLTGTGIYVLVQPWMG